MMKSWWTFALALIVYAPTTMLLAQATKPAEAEPPATQPILSPEARDLLAQLEGAYANLKSLELAGTYELVVDAAGSRTQRQARFTASFVAPNRFRHEMSDDALLVGTGSKTYLYVPRAARYAESESPKERAEGAGLDAPVLPVLRSQNPSLLLAMCSAPGDELLEDATSVELAPEERIAERSYKVLRITQPEEDLRILIDPDTNLIRRMEIDLAKMLTARGVPEVRTARITIDYTTAAPDAAVAEGAFAWTPPADAVLARSTSVALAGGEPQALVGQRAPAFTLKDLEGNDVSLAKLRGNVVVLDFWATWCPPCRESMPGLQKLHEELGDQGVKVIAVNQREEPELIRKYLEASKLTLPVVLDPDAAVAAKYAVSGIPQTVVIGKGGRVANVFVGFSPQSEQKLREAVQKAIATP